MSKNNKKQQYICPHCLGRFYYDSFWFECFKDGKSEKIHTEACEELAKNKKKISDVRKKMPEYNEAECEDKVIIDDCDQGFFKCLDKHKDDEVPDGATCYYCGEVATHHICPNPECHKEIEIDSNAKQFIVNLAGAKTSGKTVYLGALLYAINTILPEITNQWQVSLNDEADSYCKAFGQFILNSPDENNDDMTNEKLHGFRDGTGATQSKPAIVTFKYQDQNAPRSYSFIFYDIAGEVIVSREKIRDRVKKAKQFSYPDYIILLNDPAQLKGARADAKERKNIPESTREFFLGEKHIDKNYQNNLPRSDKIVTDVSDFIKEIIKLTCQRDKSMLATAKKRLNIPVAVCISMIDELKNLYNAEELKQRWYMKSSTYAEDKDISKFLNKLGKKSDNLRTQFAVWNDTAFVNTVDHSFSASAFFGLSALGSDFADITDGKIKDLDKEYKPINVLDPFIWIISKAAPEILKREKISENFGSWEFEPEEDPDDTTDGDGDYEESHSSASFEYDDEDDD